jgi:signal transduction histidine kinase
VTAASLWQVFGNREKVVPILILSALVTTVQNKLLDAPEMSQATAIVLAFIGIIGALFVQRHMVVYVTGYAAMILLTRLWWAYDWEDLSLHLITGVVAAVSVIFGSTVMFWLRKQINTMAGRHRNLFEHAPVSLWEEDFSRVGQWLDSLRAEGVTDIDGYLAEHPESLVHAASLVTVTSVNEAAVELMEADRSSELLGGLVAINDAVATALAPQLRAIWNDEDRVVIELDGAETTKGTMMEVLLYWSAPRVGGRLELKRVTVAVVDITKQRDAERQLHDLLRSKDDFVATVSHELRTPLTAVVGLAEELRDHDARFDAEERRELVGLIADQGLEVSKIVDDLLVAARAEGGTLDVIVEPLDLVELVASVLRSQGMTATVALHARRDVPPVLGDGGRVRQIVRNLITNSQRYGGSTVRVVVEESGGNVELQVRDDGNALPHALREAIFDPYYRARQTKGVTASVGLGLTVSRDLARRMGGDLHYSHDGQEAILSLTLRATAADHPSLSVSA